MTRREVGAAVVALVVCGAGLVAACGPLARVIRPRGATPHERYAESLRRAGLAERGLGRDWLAAGELALRTPLAVTAPFRESGYFAPDTAAAVAWAVAGRRGQRLVVDVETRGTQPFVLFVDLFRADAGATPPWAPVESAADSGFGGSPRRLAVELDRDGRYLLRLQPELLRGGRYTVTIALAPVLAFPVQGRDARAVRSFWGAEREAGRRVHQGIDIFAPRGTPALAAAAGVVLGVGLNRLGGKIVWLQDERHDVALYYAHLDTQLVARGRRVRPGDTLGLVGNTGNARTTSPHLHFGIYTWGYGPLDPLPWVRDPGRAPPPVLADTAPLGALARTTPEHVPLRAAPADDAPAVATLPRATPLRIAGGVGGRVPWWRVRLPDGTAGYLPAPAVERPRAVVAARRLARRAALLDAPVATAAPIDSLPIGTAVGVLGRWKGFDLARDGAGRVGWMVRESVAAAPATGTPSIPPPRTRPPARGSSRHPRSRARAASARAPP